MMLSFEMDFLRNPELELNALIITNFTLLFHGD